MSSSPAANGSGSPGWQAPSAKRLGEMLPQYDISAMIGRGGMGAVYRGRQAKLNRDVAIKVLPETFTQGGDEQHFVKRFEQEAQAMANLDHPAIISVYDFGETEDGQIYFVMEFVDGVDIQQFLQQSGGKISQEHALSITAHVLDALDYAHGHGIMHRDIKPANILLNHEGRVKIADFGLAKTLAGPDDDDNASPSRQAPLTKSDVAVGTPDFVAPEALDSDRVPDHRADLYAVGVMLYQMLTGSLPRGQFKLPSERLPAIDPRIDDIISKALQADPDDRYASASEVRLALDPIFSSPMSRIDAAMTGNEAVPEKKPGTSLFFCIGAAALVLILGIAFAMNRDTGDRIVAGASLPLNPKPDAEAKPSTGTKANGSPAVAPVSSVSEEEPESDGLHGETAQKTSPAKADSDSRKMPAQSESPTVTTASGKMPVPLPDTTPSVAVNGADKDRNSPSTDDAKGSKNKATLLETPGLKSRLDSYLIARRTQVTELANRYLSGLQSRLDQAADAGDLKLARAFRAEKQQVERLQAALKERPDDILAAVVDGEAATLVELTDDSPRDLVALRTTWTTERDSIREDLDAALQDSLKHLESKLTRDREFDHAARVIAWREALLAGEAGNFLVATTPDPDLHRVPIEVAVQAQAPDSVVDSESLVAFPLPVPRRSKMAGRLEVHRRDGKSLGETDKKNGVTQIPAALGDRVVGAVSGRWGGESAMMALLADGTVVGWGDGATTQSLAAEGVFTNLTDVVAMGFPSDRPVFLHEDGSLSVHLRGANRQAVQTPSGGRFVALATNAHICLALTDRGQIVVAAASGQTKRHLPADLPPVTYIAIARAGNVWAFGSDGIWRSWVQNRPDEIWHAEANQALTRPVSAISWPKAVWWVDGRNGYHARERSHGSGAVDNSRYVSRGEGRHLVQGVDVWIREMQPGKWKCGTTRPAETDCREIERTLEGVRFVAFSWDHPYYYAVRLPDNDPEFR